MPLLTRKHCLNKPASTFTFLKLFCLVKLKWPTKKFILCYLKSSHVLQFVTKGLTEFGYLDGELSDVWTQANGFISLNSQPHCFSSLGDPNDRAQHIGVIVQINQNNLGRYDKPELTSLSTLLCQAVGTISLSWDTVG